MPGVFGRAKDNDCVGGPGLVAGGGVDDANAQRQKK
jgi:hypothetical protein